MSASEHPVDGDAHGAAGSICPTCDDVVPGEQASAEGDGDDVHAEEPCEVPPRPWEGSTCLCGACVPAWFAPLRRRVDAWIEAHPGEAYPVPASVQEVAAGRPLSSARVLLHYLGARGVQTIEGPLPEVRAP